MMLFSRRLFGQELLEILPYGFCWPLLCVICLHLDLVCQRIPHIEEDDYGKGSKAYLDLV